MFQLLIMKMYGLALAAAVVKMRYYEGLLHI